MGGGSYNDTDYEEQQETRKKKGHDTFQYSVDVKRGKDSEGRAVERRIHPTLDIFGKVRESRDNECDSIAVAFIFDVTGSMEFVPKVFQQKIPTLMKLLLDHGWTAAKPQILFGMVGDTNPHPRADEFPFQVGEFEADVRMEKHLTNGILEKGGGGQFSESYELAFAYFGTRTSIDCWEKRRKKGYLFVSGDECAHPVVSAKDLSQIFGVPTKADMPVEEAIKAADEKYHLFFIIPGGSNHYHRDDLRKHWDGLLGHHRVIKLEDPNLISETVGLAVALTEGKIRNLDAGIAELGISGYQAQVLQNALGEYARSLRPNRD